MNTIRLCLSAVILELLMTLSAYAQTQPDVVISFDREFCNIVVDTGSAAVSFRFAVDKIEMNGRSIGAGGSKFIEGDSLIVAGRTVNLAAMTVAEVLPMKSLYEVRLQDASASRRSRTGGNSFASFTALRLNAGEFIRGSAMVVGGNLESDAEVNGFVVALFGDVVLGPTATCHRDVIAIGGRIRKDSKSRIYGATQSTESWKRSDIFRRRRHNYGYQPVEISTRFSYDRVDGLTPNARITFQSEENFVPRFFAEAGYGTASERGKYRLGFDHRIFDYSQLRFGASVYRQTKTADDWLCWYGENTVYALLRREDFRDYYQGEGGVMFIEQDLGTRHRIRADLLIETLDSMPAHPRLWALVGGSKDFRSNFSSIQETERGKLLGLYSGDEAVLKLSYLYQTVGEIDIAATQGWRLSLQYEHSSKSIASDFKYDRITAEVRRSQKLGDYQALNLRAKYGKLNGNGPLHALFYLGGIRTLRGHEIKQYYGTEMALVNIEYVFNPTHTILDFAALFDLGSVGEDRRSLADSQWYGDYGVAVIVGEYFRFELTRAFNGSSDDLQPSVLLGASF